MADLAVLSLNAVSYTHLDVYKRQNQDWLEAERETRNDHPEKTNVA